MSAILIPSVPDVAAMPGVVMAGRGDVVRLL
jgi:hypothetical protein